MSGFGAGFSFFGFRISRFRAFLFPMVPYCQNRAGTQQLHFSNRPTAHHRRL